MATNGNMNPLERTSDMEGLSASERARIYKERAAAAGIGQPPSAEQPAAPAPAPSAAEPAAPEPRSTAAVRPAAQPAAAVAGQTLSRPAAGALSPEQRERLAAAVQRGAAQPAATASPAAEQQGRLVYVWPHLLTIELMAAVLMLLSMIVISVVLQAPLEGHANADKTPNPSKAPWYFLNLQELLLHMHPALAGVLVPSGALALIAIIPFFDRDTRDVGKWFGTPKATPIAWFTTWYAAVVLTLLVIFDEMIGVKPMMKFLAWVTGLDLFNALFMTDIGVPMLLMNAPIVILLGLLYGSREGAAPRPISRRQLGLLAVLVVAAIAATVAGTLWSQTSLAQARAAVGQAIQAQATEAQIAAAWDQVRQAMLILLALSVLAAATALAAVYVVSIDWVLRSMPKPGGVRDLMICLFTGFLAAYVVLTIYGTFFRGQGMHLYWPWDPRQIRIE